MISTQSSQYLLATQNINCTGVRFYVDFKSIWSPSCTSKINLENVPDKRILTKEYKF